MMTFRSALNHSTILKAVALAGALIGASFVGDAKADGTQMVVRDRFSDQIAGNGSDIVFIPGLASSRDTWKNEAARLADHYRVHLIQIAGFAGETSRANASGEVLVPTAEAIDAYLLERHLTPTTLIGHSLGGTIALYLVEKHPTDIKKAMLVDTLPFYATLMRGPTATVEMMKPAADGIRTNPAGSMSGPRYDQMLMSMATAQADRDTIKAWGNASEPNVVGNAVADDLTLDLRPGLAKILIPLTLLFPDYAAAGSTDGMYRGAYAAETSIKFVAVTNSLHFIMLDQPKQFDAAVDEFLKE
jgi:pimeloyl-[acyl-carrier protein] methyl ester esterase